MQTETSRKRLSRCLDGARALLLEPLYSFRKWVIWPRGGGAQLEAATNPSLRSQSGPLKLKKTNFKSRCFSVLSSQQETRDKKGRICQYCSEPRPVKTWYSSSLLDSCCEIGPSFCWGRSCRTANKRNWQSDFPSVRCCCRLLPSTWLSSIILFVLSSEWMNLTQFPLGRSTSFYAARRHHPLPSRLPAPLGGLICTRNSVHSTLSD